MLVVSRYGVIFSSIFQVEQLHKIFKLCGSPTDEYWKKSKLPHATIFKPHHQYPSALRDAFKEVPENALKLMETLLSVEPYRRGTASGALTSEVRLHHVIPVNNTVVIHSSE
jgi:hypothetical protein